MLFRASPTRIRISTALSYRLSLASRATILRRTSNQSKPTPSKQQSAVPRPTPIQRLLGLFSSTYGRLRRQSQSLFSNIVTVGPLRISYWAFVFTLLFHIGSSYFYALNVTYGISMLPTLNSSGDWVLISKYYRRGRDVAVGDLVSFAHPADDGVYAIKRVIGLEGDFVGIGPGFVDDDGEEVGRARGGKMIQVPQGHCWVVGDNLRHSRDSRLFGPLPLALIRGRVIARYPPLEWIQNGLHPAAEEDDID